MSRPMTLHAQAQQSNDAGLLLAVSLFGIELFKSFPASPDSLSPGTCLII